MVTAVSQTLPAEFQRRMRSLLGDEFPAFLASFDQPRVRSLRLNPAKASVDDLRRLLGVPLEPIPWCPTGFVVPLDASLGGHPARLSGLYYLQEPSSMSVAEALDPQDGWIVADLAAAPGGKTTHLSVLLGDAGLVVANEVVGSRLRLLHDNLDLWGSRNVLTMSSPIANLDMLFDGVILDAPCSGEGLFRRDAASIREWSPGAVRGSARRQSRLLDEASRLVRPGGVLVYSTCTFELEENEEVVAQFLESATDWALENPARWPGFRPGRGVPSAETEKTVRLWPHCVSGEGQFFAQLRRGTGGGRITGDVSPRGRSSRPADRGKRRFRAAGNSGEAKVRQAWSEFHDRVAPGLAVPADRLLVRNDQIYLVPKKAASLDTPMAAFARPGLPLGRIRPGRFEPHPALATALSTAEAAQHVSLELDDPALVAFLRGETVSSSGTDGWTLICLERWGLGWAKRSQGVLKNMLPPSTRHQAARWDARRR